MGCLYAAFGAIYELVFLDFGLAALELLEEHSQGERAAGTALRLGSEAYQVLVRHSNKPRTGIAFLVSNTARLELGKIISRA